MSLPLPEIDFLGAQILRYTASVARRTIPGFCDCWLTLATGDLVQLRFSEVRGLSDLGLSGSVLDTFEEIPKSPFATNLPATPVFTNSQAGRVFRFLAERDYRGAAHPRGEIVATAVRLIEPMQAVPAVSELAAPIPWSQAQSMLVSTRVLSLEGFSQDGKAVAEVHIGSPRGEYALRASGLVKLEDHGYPGDRGLADATLRTNLMEQQELGLIPGAKGSEKRVEPIHMVADGIVVARVKKQA